MNFFEVITIDEARERLAKRCGALMKTETVPLSACLTRIVAQDVVSLCDVPPFNKSTVDGYAVRVADTHGATESVPAFLQVTGSVNMGTEPKTEIVGGDACAVPTGGMLPAGADGVVMTEHTESFGASVAVYRPLKYFENVLQKGEDISTGTVIAEKGGQISALCIGSLAACGITAVEVFSKIKVYIISTGDELVGVEDTVKAGQIRDVNVYSLSALVTADGCEVVGTERVKDDFASLVAAIERGVGIADTVLLSGGSSVGEKDYTYTAIKSFGGEVFVKGIALKPGKPTIVGQVHGKPVFGLPGHPMAAAVAYRMLADNVFRRVRGQKPSVGIPAVTDMNFPSSPGRTTCQPVSLYVKDGVRYATPLFGKSDQINVLSRADGYVVIPENAEGVDRGRHVEVFSL